MSSRPGCRCGSTSPHFQAPFHDIRGDDPTFAPFYDRESYRASQEHGRRLLDGGSNGIVYRSVRHPGGECLACFWPRLVLDVRQGAHFEYRWHGRPEPTVHGLPVADCSRRVEQSRLS